MPRTAGDSPQSPQAFVVLKHMSKRELRALVGAEDPASPGSLQPRRVQLYYRASGATRHANRNPPGHATVGERRSPTGLLPIPFTMAKNYRVAFPYREFISQWKRQKGKESFPYGFYHSQYINPIYPYIRSCKGEFLFFHRFFFVTVANSQVNLKVWRAAGRTELSYY